MYREAEVEVGVGVGSSTGETAGRAKGRVEVGAGRVCEEGCKPEMIVATLSRANQTPPPSATTRMSAHIRPRPPPAGAPRLTCPSGTPRRCRQADGRSTSERGWPFTTVPRPSRRHSLRDHRQRERPRQAGRYETVSFFLHSSHQQISCHKPKPPPAVQLGVTLVHLFRTRAPTHSLP